jgi:hypothetical protein
MVARYEEIEFTSRNQQIPELGNTTGIQTFLWIPQEHRVLHIEMAMPIVEQPMPDLMISSDQYS